MDRNLKVALQRLAEQGMEGALSERLQCATDMVLDGVIVAYANTLPGNTTMKKSKAARMLMQRGALALLADEHKEARRRAVRRKPTEVTG
jgi:hypothetical protein